ncbi:MAG: hypothetical protein A2937_01655 [Candidatus Yonathbacteria bacterium RIFCSPLOWO2_01_FULL_47_33b]|uniref:Uncharacterized protein n=1 Tax=Candidatus Yonathbacteria bacterium RIFCSPLOWO2_01_FULL_47_33b TaxID=1802727 RepID=A0A1G2SJ24_9BACT|nr:MAG: hypothetical protein A2937_01655 [Candidatus Yonathbacteria bacterium RIFCSPLOWO2_01_FULL_47_33b]
MTPQTKKMMMNVATGALVLGVIAGGYFAFVGKKMDTTTSGATVSTPGIAQTIAISTDISRTKTELSELKKAVAASVEVFTSTEFRSLQDFTVQVYEEPVGRDNPFMITDWKTKMKDEEAAASRRSSSGASSVTPSTPEVVVPKSTQENKTVTPPSI